ncbi:MAG: lipase family protein, partial [Bacillota bacterium]
MSVRRCPMGRVWSRMIALACVTVLLTGAVVTAGGSTVSAWMEEDEGRDGGEESAPGGRLPLAYIGPEGSGGGLLDRLRAQGYVEGRDLIVVAGGERDYVLEAVDVAAAIRQAQGGDGGRVNVITVGVSGLAARLALLVGRDPAPVRTLIMIAPPNRGSFAATALRLAAQLERQLAFRVAIGRLPAGERPSDPDPIDEAAYVAARALTVYEPLVIRYFREDKLSSEGGGHADFLTWLAHKEKALFDRTVAGAQAPPAMDRYPGIVQMMERPPEVDESLTRAFLEVEAMRAAEYNYARLYQNKGPISLKDLDLLEAIPKAKAGGLKRFILDLFSKIVASLGGRALAERRTQAEELVVSELLDFDAWATPAARLTTEDYTLPMGGGAAPGDGDVILANYFLEFWNEREAARRETLENQATFATSAGPPDPRYVTIAPNWPNLWT